MENQKAQLKRMLDLKVNPIDGLASKWDYENNRWNPIPESLSDENQKAQLKRMLDLKVNPIDGLASKWDYENNRWK
ncbi:cytochrome c oxidase subunit IV domain-containing protein [Phthorimaea operculella]|nr:cytochrome c oxidase subunit IV domain-containing protein [Phthorimaea operculella]